MGVYKNLIEPFLMGLPLRLLGGVKFDKSNDYGQIAHADEVQLASGTFSFRIRFTTTQNLVIFEKSANNTNWWAQTGFNNTAGNGTNTEGRVIMSVRGNSANNFVSSDVINNNEWHRVGFTAAADTLEQRAYTNGVSSSSPRVMLDLPAANTQPWNIGARGTGTLGAPMDFAEFAMYNVVKSPAYMLSEADTLKRYALGLIEKPAGLVWCYADAPVAVTGQAWTHEWTDIVSGRVMKLYNNPTAITYER